MVNHPSSFVCSLGASRTWGAANVVQGKLADPRIELEQQR